MTNEEIDLFRAYVLEHGKTQVRKGWALCLGPWYSIKFRNTFGPTGLAKLNTKRDTLKGE